MRETRVDEEDILASARNSRGVERMDRITDAVLDRSGGISVVPKLVA